MNDIKTVQQMINEMLSEDVKQAEIARLSKTSPEQISRLKNGQKPTYDLGKRIEAVYLNHFDSKAA